MAFRLEANCVDEAVDDWLANYGCNEFAQPVVGVEIDRFETNFLRVRQAVLIHIANHHHCRTENARGCRGR